MNKTIRMCEVPGCHRKGQHLGTYYKTELVVTIAEAPLPTKWILKGGKT